MAEPGAARVRPRAPHVPPAVRPPFLWEGGHVATWSVGGLYLALAPSLAGELLDTHSHLAGGAAVLALAGPGGLAQLAFHKLPPRTAMGAGSLVLAAGMAATVASLSTGSAAIFLVASAITGGGIRRGLRGGDPA